MLGGELLEQGSPRSDGSGLPCSRASEKNSAACAWAPVRAAAIPAAVAYRSTRSGSPAPRAWCTSTAGSSVAPDSSASSIRRCRAASAPGGSDLAMACRHRSWRKATPRWLRRVRPAWCRARSGPTPMPSCGSSRSGMASGAHTRRSSRSRAASSRSTVLARMASRTVRGSVVAVVVEHLDDEERVAAGERVQVVGVDGPVVDQGAHAVAAQGSEVERHGVRGTGRVAEQGTQRVRRGRARPVAG